jgi:hypothetical protein
MRVHEFLKIMKKGSGSKLGQSDTKYAYTRTNTQ